MPDTNINIQGSPNSEVNVILAKSYEYQDLLDRLKTKQELFDLVPEENIEKRLQLSTEINQLNEVFEQFKRDVLALAETFNKIEINTDRLSRAKEFFDKGEIGEARAVLETELEQMQDEQTYLLKEKEKYETRVLPNLINNSEEFYLLAMATQTDYDNPNRFEDTCNYFETSIKSHATKHNVFQWAYFLKAHNQFSKAEKFYQKYLNDFASEISITERAMTLNNLAILHSDQNNYDEALKEFEEALQIYRQLAETNPHAYLPDVAMTLNNLANLHKAQNNYDEALKEFEEALQIYRQLAETNPHAYLPDVAMTLNNLAVLHKDQNNYDEALKEFEEALQIYRQLAETNPHAYLPDVAMTLNNLANLHSDQNNYDEALQLYEEALQIRRQLAETNPHAYLPYVAGTLNNLAVLHKDQNNYDEALKEFEEALQIYRQLAETNPHAYLPKVAMTLINISVYYQDAISHREKSLECVLEALLIILPIVEKVPFTQRYKQSAMYVLRDWNLSDEEISQMIGEKMKKMSKINL